MSERMMRLIAATTGGAIGGGSLGAILGTTGAASNTGKAIGWGVLVGGIGGLASSGAVEAIEMIRANGSEG